MAAPGAGDGAVRPPGGSDDPLPARDPSEPILRDPPARPPLRFVHEREPMMADAVVPKRNKRARGSKNGARPKRTYRKRRTPPNIKAGRLGMTPHEVIRREIALKETQIEKLKMALEVLG